VNAQFVKTPNSPTVLFALPVPKFFSQQGGVGGHVSHVRGVLGALRDSGSAVDCLAAEMPTDGLSMVRDWTIVPGAHTAPLKRFLWGKQFVNAIAKAVARSDYSYCYMRYSAQFAPLIPQVKQALSGVPLVLELNSFATQQASFPLSLYRPIERCGLQAADAILCVSSRLRDDVEMSLGEDVSARCFVIPNGVDPTRFAAPEGLKDDARSTKRLCYCGVLKENYGLEELLAAHRTLEVETPGLRLDIIGEGAHRAHLETSKQRGQNVVFHGAVAFDKVPLLLAEMDVLVHCTSMTNRFQSPIKIYEYMCTGRPIVAADTPQTRRVLGGRKECGLLYQIGDHYDLMAVLKNVLADKSLGESLANNARDVVVAEHTWQQRIDALQQELAQRGVLNG